MSCRQQDENWERGNVQDKVGLDRDVGGREDKNTMFTTLVRLMSEVESRVVPGLASGCRPSRARPKLAKPSQTGPK